MTQTPTRAPAPSRQSIEPTDPAFESRRDFYEDAYSSHNAKTQAWKALCAQRNIQLIAEMLDRQGWQPRRIVDVGCGDGSLLARLTDLESTQDLVGYEIAPAAVAFASARAIPRVSRIEVFDGAHVPELDDSFDLGVLSWVIEHALDPVALVREVARISPRVFLIVVLDDTVAARRPAHSHALGGQIQRFTRESATAVIEEAGLRIVESVVRYPTVREGVYWASGGRQRARAYAQMLTKHAMHRVAPRFTERLFAASLACLAVRDNEA